MMLRRKNKPIKQPRRKGGGRSHVRFDLRGDEYAAKMVDYFINECNTDILRSKNPRSSPLDHSTSWLRDPSCRALAEHPTILAAAKEVMGLPAGAPVYLFGMAMRKKEAGSTHRLHSDMEFSSKECRNKSGTTQWIFAQTECFEGEKSPLTLLSGSHNLDSTAHDELICRKCWSVASQKLPCNIDQILAEVEAENANVKIVSGPNVPMMGIGWPSTAWHTTEDKCTRRAISIK